MRQLGIIISLAFILSIISVWTDAFPQRDTEDNETEDDEEDLNNSDEERENKIHTLIDEKLATHNASASKDDADAAIKASQVLGKYLSKAVTEVPQEHKIIIQVVPNDKNAERAETQTTTETYSNQENVPKQSITSDHHLRSTIDVDNSVQTGTPVQIPGIQQAVPVDLSNIIFLSPYNPAPTTPTPLLLETYDTDNPNALHALQYLLNALTTGGVERVKNDLQQAEQISMKHPATGLLGSWVNCLLTRRNCITNTKRG